MSLPSTSHDREVGASHEAVMRSIRYRLLPARGAGLARNVLYAVGFMRVLGQREGAAAVDRAGTGKVYAAGDRRAEETAAYFDQWMGWGVTSERTTESVLRVRRIHDHYAKQYAMSQPTYLHAIAFFTLQFDILLRLVGAPPFDALEREAQLTHWRAVGELLGVQDMPDTWDGMELAMREYEASPEWFGFTPAARLASDAVIEQFSRRWLPQGLRWAAGPILCSLNEPHVLDALGQPHPPAVVAWVVRRVVRTALAVTKRLPGPSDVLSQPEPTRAK